LADPWRAPSEEGGPDQSRPSFVAQSCGLSITAIDLVGDLGVPCIYINGEVRALHSYFCALSAEVNSS